MREIDQIIQKALLSEANLEERALLDAWLNSDVNHFTEFVKLKSYWESQVKYKKTIQADEAFERFKKNKLYSKPKNHKTHYFIGLITTAVAVCALLLILANPFKTKLPVEFSFSTNAEKDTLLLPDSSTVILNKNTTLVYTSNYNKKNRHLKLSGEAFFDVRKNPKVPFIVEMGHSRITVLGTIFNVRSYEVDDYIRATLVEGSIRFNKDNDQVTLKPNQELNYNKKNEEISIRKVDLRSSVLWLKNVYRFQSTPMQTLLNELGTIFDKTISISNPKIAKTVVSGSFQNNQDLNEILTILSRSVPIKWEINADQVIIN